VRLVRYGPKGSEKPGALDAQGGVRDLSNTVADLGGNALLPARLERLVSLALGELPSVPSPARFGPPIANIGKIIGVGLNYRDHAAETKLPLPKEPTLFLKPTSALNGPHDGVLIPRDGRSLDWEIELGVVIGQAGVYIAENAAMDHVAGYCVGIDFSEREFQFNRGGQGFKGKSSDTFAPLGPWLVTKDEVPDPHALALKLAVNGAVRQDSNTNGMIFSVPELVSYVSRFMSLQPGDVILTGTPAGVGLGQNPPTYLNAGDEVVATIEGLGEQRHRIAETKPY
jgi:2-keto-4-pentenoate hydratase/2-oxohepta-3-ene-1,7-dioic acid hydratase in catechol pathway